MQPGSWQTELQNAIIQRLSLLNPIVALTETRKFSEPRQQSLIPLVYREWAVSNLDHAIAHAQSFEDDEKRSVVESIVLSRADLPVGRLRDIAESLGHESTAIKMLREQRGLVAIKNPKRELRKFLNQNSRSLDDLNEEQSALLIQILRAWLVQEGIEVYEEIEKSFPQSFLKKFGRTNALGMELIQENPGLALQLAVKARSVGFGGLADNTVRRWATTDPVEALNAVSTLEGASLRKSLQSRIMESWAARDPYALLNASRNMPVDVQAIGEEKALFAIAQSSPQTAVGLLDDIADRDIRDRIASGIASSWVLLDVDAAIEWIENNESVSSKGNLRDAAVISLVRINPHLALKVASELPPDEFGRGLEYRAINRLSDLDLEMAIELLPLARDNKTKTDAYDSIMWRLLHVQSDFQHAFNLFIQLAEDVGSPQKGLFTLMWHSPKQLYESLNELPTEELKRQAAGLLLRNHESTGLFTDEQLEGLQELDDTPRIRITPEIEAAFEELMEAID